MIETAAFVAHLAFGLFLMLILVPLAFAAALMVIVGVVQVIGWFTDAHA